MLHYLILCYLLEAALRQTQAHLPAVRALLEDLRHALPGEYYYYYYYYFYYY